MTAIIIVAALIVILLIARLMRANADAVQRQINGAASERPEQDERRYMTTWNGNANALPQERSAAGPVVVSAWRPAYQPSVESQVAVPVLIALVIAVSGLVPAVALAAWQGWGWHVPALTFGVLFPAALLWRLGVADNLVRAVEEVTHRDINRDGQIGGATGYTVVNPPRREPVARDRTAERRAMLSEFVDRCLLLGTSETAHGVKSPAERTSHILSRDALMDCGIARWRNPADHRAGWEIVVNADEAYRLIEYHIV